MCSAGAGFYVVLAINLNKYLRLAYHAEAILKRRCYQELWQECFGVLGGMFSSVRGQKLPVQCKSCLKENFYYLK